jgi:hypothetical protein
MMAESAISHGRWRGTVSFAKTVTKRRGCLQSGCSLETIAWFDEGRMRAADR